AREAYTIMGAFPRESIEVERVLSDAREIYEDHPDLPVWAHDACERVYGKWSSDGDLASGARDWALNLIVEYAQADGVVLK
ncbi:hypothetical protein, partial [Enterobacter cloacae]|uniref:hypothetical protein n=1 Tax=Enterobacter cloacae TaxID=550 RepID=UPI0013D2FEB9